MNATPANWYPDPTGRHELRYWDGTAWTDHVSNQGVAGSDPVQQRSGMDRLDAGLTVGDEGRAETINKQLTGTGHQGIGLDGPVAGGGGTLLDEPILVVNQKAKLIELNNQYSVFDQHGTQIAAVNQVGQSTAKKVMRLVSSIDQFMTHHLEITDAAGQVVLKITRPRKVIKSTVVVSDGQDREIGRVVQQNMVGKINFGLEANGHPLGAIKAENWRAWNFRIEDNAGNEIARITKTWEGLAKTMFTTADNYVLQVHHRPLEPLNSLVVASALSIDTALNKTTAASAETRLVFDGPSTRPVDADLTARPRRIDQAGEGRSGGANGAGAETASSVSAAGHLTERDRAHRSKLARSTAPASTAAPGRRGLLARAAAKT